MEKETKNNKGSITLFVIISCIFILIILGLLVIQSGNKKMNQEDELNEINHTYYQNENQLDETYQSIVSKE